MSREAVATLRVAAGLALAAAVSLGLARFSYALLLPPMRADLGWSYLTAGAMNTVNAAGYLIGALLAPRWLARHDARALLLAGSVGDRRCCSPRTACVPGEAALYALRLLSGVASAAMFVSGGLLAARLVSGPAVGHGARRDRVPGLVLGIYYGGTGVGIIASAAIVPAVTALPLAHAWQWAWLALAAAALLATAVMARATRRIGRRAQRRRGRREVPTGAASPSAWRRT